MSKFWSISLSVFCLGLLTVSSLFAQTTNSRIEGTVKDSSGGLVPNASVIVTNKQTNASKTVTANKEGVFNVSELAPGEYNVRIEAANFRSTNIDGVIVSVGTPALINATLTAGNISETVEVSAEDAQETINSTNAEIGDVVDRRRVLDLPLDGRNPLDLISLQAGASETGQVNGNRARAINITINGINASDNFNKSVDNIVNNPTIPVSVESVREFRVTTGMATAEYGRGSAQVNVVSASGGKDYRGSLFEFHRNTALNANNFFNNRSGIKREFLLRNQYGGRFGGPIRIPYLYNGKDKTFFFFAYEGTKLVASETTNSTVYTAEAKAGNFRYVQGLTTTPANVAANPTLIRTVNLFTLPTTSNRTPDPFLAKYIGDIPTPNNFDVGDGLNTGGFRFNAKRSAPKDIYSFRADHRFNDKFNWEVNYSYGNDFQYGDYVNARYQRFPGGDGVDRLLRSRSISTALQMTLSAQTVNEFRFGFANPSTEFNNKSYTGKYVITLNTVTDPIRFTAPNGRNVPIKQFMDNFTHIRGNHMFKAGFDIRFLKGSNYSYDASLPDVNLNSTDNDPGYVVANFPGLANTATNLQFAERLINNLTGAIGSINQTFYADSPTDGFVSGRPLHRTYKTNEFDFYAQDTWKFRPNLTLNLGLRYEYSTVPKDVDELFVLPVGGIQGIFGPTLQANLFTPGNATAPRTVTNLVSNDYQFFKPDRNNFAPVVSFAWSPFKNNKTSLRAGYRVSYIRENFQLYENVARTNLGLTLTRELIVGNRFLRDGVPTIPAPSMILPLSAEDQFRASATSSIAGFDTNLKTPYIQEWTGSIEHEIFKNTVLEARYVGNKGLKLIRVYDINEVNVNAFDPTSGQTFLQAFNIAQRNLINNQAITLNNPLFARIFSGAAASQATNTAITTPIRNGEAGELADVISRRNAAGRNGGILFNSGLPVNFFRPNPDVQAAYYASNGSRSSFHALQIELRRRFRQGFSFQVNYQFGKELSDFTGSSTNQSAFITLRDTNYEYQAQGRYHQVKGNFIYELPFGNRKMFFNRKGWTNKLVGGWQLGGIIRWESGVPLSITSGRGTVNSITRSAGNTVDVVSGLSLEQLRSQVGVRTVKGPNGNDILSFFDSPFAANFANPQPGKLGSLGRAVFEGPRYFRTDLSVIKRTSITERQNVEFRAEFFNAFNNVNFATPNMNFNSANFGLISDVRGGTLGQPRIIQLALRYNF